jgi:thiamine-phosphate pyrophosphorylase
LNRVGFRLYLVTDGWDATTAARVDAALAVLPPGSAAVQLRARSLSGRALYEAAQTLGAVTRARGAPLVVNDRGDVALAVGAAGVHLPARGLPAKVARRLVGAPLLVGASTHSLDEAEMAARGGADFVCFGPVLPTASKAPYGPPLGWEALAAAARLPVPVFAIGGIDAAAAARAATTGARAACIGAVLGQATPAAAAHGARAMATALAL